MRHVSDNHEIELNIANGGGDVGGPTQTRMDPTTSQIIKKYNKLRNREEITKMVAVGCLPFSFPSSDAFIHYIHVIYNPMFNDIPRSTRRTDMFRLHSQYCFCLSTLLKNIQCRMSLNSDLGRAVNKNNYLIITSHWIDSNFVTQKCILAFLYDEDRKHTGQFIAESIGKVVEFYGIENKILCIAFDNASNNKTAITNLKVKLSPPLPEIFYIKCACHIYNLIVRDGLEFFELYIEKIHLAVGFIQGNNRRSRMKEFKVKCEQNGLAPILIPEECDTRWNAI
ncbi:hypothetical protein P3S68_021971 [Capsicum galapagoense]